MKIIDFADSVFRNLNSPDDISVVSIVAWARFGINIGKLNSLLGKNYSLDTTTLEILDTDGVEIGDDEAAIYELIYKINYYDRQTNKFLGAGGTDVTILQEATSDGGTLRFTSRNEIAKSFMQIRNGLKTELDKLLNYYKFGKSRAVQVIGDDISVSLTSLRLESEIISNGTNGITR